MSDTSLSQLAADLSRLHILLSLADGEPDDYFDPRFEAAIKRRLNRDPAQVRQLRQIATEVSMLVAG
ncbi:MAG: hypothetical protein DMF58_01845 [Acidobacteria bacterium]|nr:MAG: hypothetical protein DMF58_01845 [Acidobacteriota bacterium]